MYYCLRIFSIKVISSGGLQVSSYCIYCTEYAVARVHRNLVVLAHQMSASVPAVHGSFPLCFCVGRDTYRGRDSEGELQAETVCLPA